MDAFPLEGWMQLISESGLHDQALVLIIVTFCAASALCLSAAVLALFLRVRNSRKSTRWQNLECTWTTLVMGVLDGTVRPAEACATVQPDEQLYFVDFAYRHARKVHGEDRELLRELAAPFLGAVAHRLRSGDETTRARAVRTLGVLAPQEYRSLIVGALDDPSSYVALIAAHTLALDRDSDATGPVLEHLSRFKRWNSKFLSALLAGAGPRACPILRDAMTDPGRPTWQRVVAAGALRELQDPLAGDAAAAVLARAKGRNLESAMLRLLADLGGPEHLSPVRLRCSHRDSVIRAQAMRALGRLGGKEDLLLLRKGLEDSSPWVAMQAAAGLRRVGGYDQLRQLLDGSREQALLDSEMLAGSAD